MGHKTSCRMWCMAGVLLGVLGMLAGTVAAGETGHYVNGVEGIKAATVPGPGFYARTYNVYYTADDLKDEHGSDVPVDFSVDVAAEVTRLIYISPFKIFGADYGGYLVMPFQKTDIKVAGAGDEEAGCGDLSVSPLLLSWHKERFDVSFAYDVTIPTGDHDNMASNGKDFYTHMFTLGGTYYFDVDKTWSASILSRFEINDEKLSSEINPGEDFHFEWGVAKSIKPGFDVGVAGYCQWQVTDDTGSDVTWDKDVHDQVYAVGPEVSYFYAPWKLNASLRYLTEFDAHDRSEGSITCLTLTKIF